MVEQGLQSQRTASGRITIPDFRKVGNLVIQKSQVQDLEEKASVASDALKVFFEQENLDYIARVSEGYENLKESLSVVTGRAKFLRWERTMPEAKFLDRYLLQYVVGSIGMEAFAGDLRHYQCFQKLLTVTQELVKMREPDKLVQRILIDNTTSYKDYAPMVASRVRGYRTDLVLQAMEEIREKYPVTFKLEGR